MKQILIVEDDPLFSEALKDEFQERGYAVETVDSLIELKAAAHISPHFAVVDLKLKGESGIDAVGHIREYFPACVSIVLTGYGSIATAVQAMKAGAVNYIAKPASADDIERAFQGQIPQAQPDQIKRQSLARHEREYIEKVLQDFDGNISRAASSLGIHRQSLQRKLRKFTP